MDLIIFRCSGRRLQGLHRDLVPTRTQERRMEPLAHHVDYLRRKGLAMTLGSEDARLNQVKEYGPRISPSDEGDFPKMEVGDRVWVHPHAGKAHKLWPMARALGGHEDSACRLRGGRGPKGDPLPT
eukprot:gnl/Dysnectes_brevis/13324_a30758_68.p1 GENE.gnl/Dysnectes_brevis/13324_a30758_68~~gnl/Dysnectes_brevis/13324_a30758_68.p1  ORF type:complete len:126 (+),score=8.59 gnl/Dysnectes_brevis/13324_a30758_68:236-613(+)